VVWLRWRGDRIAVAAQEQRRQALRSLCQSANEDAVTTLEAIPSTVAETDTSLVESLRPTPSQPCTILKCK